MEIDWGYVKACGSHSPRWTEETGRQVGGLSFLLLAGKHYEDVTLLRAITTRARIVSDYLEEKNGVVPTSH